MAITHHIYYTIYIVHNRSIDFSQPFLSREECNIKGKIGATSGCDFCELKAGLRHLSHQAAVNEGATVEHMRGDGFIGDTLACFWQL